MDVELVNKYARQEAKKYLYTSSECAKIVILTTAMVYVSTTILLYQFEAECTLDEEGAPNWGQSFQCALPSLFLGMILGLGAMWIKRNRKFYGMFK